MSATNITSKCRIANIDPNDAMILPHDDGETGSQLQACVPQNRFRLPVHAPLAHACGSTQGRQSRLRTRYPKGGELSECVTAGAATTVLGVSPSIQAVKPATKKK